MPPAKLDFRRQDPAVAERVIQTRLRNPSAQRVQGDRVYECRCHWVYFIQGAGGGPVKIGFTKLDPRRRIQGLQTACPYRLRLLAAVPGSREDERHLHRRFAEMHTHGEWFDAETELLDYIETWAMSPAQVHEHRMLGHVETDYRPRWGGRCGNGTSRV